MTADVVPRMEAASPALNLPSAAKLRPSPAITGSMEGAIKMWLQVGNVQKLQQVHLSHFCTYLCYLYMYLYIPLISTFDTFTITYLWYLYIYRWYFYIPLIPLHTNDTFTYLWYLYIPMQWYLYIHLQSLQLHTFLTFTYHTYFYIPSLPLNKSRVGKGVNSYFY